MRCRTENKVAGSSDKRLALALASCACVLFIAKNICQRIRQRIRQRVRQRICYHIRQRLRFGIFSPSHFNPHIH